jgi:DNA-binding GntR family transcriptional regulator
MMSEAVFKPLEKKRYSAQIAELMQHEILRGHLETGTSLSLK